MRGVEATLELGAGMAAWRGRQASMRDPLKVPVPVPESTSASVTGSKTAKSYVPEIVSCLARPRSRTRIVGPAAPPGPPAKPDQIVAVVKGQQELPTGGHETCPLTATRTAR
jgi:hypothetical protein